MKFTLSRQEVADIFGVNPQTISNWVAYGILESKKIKENVMISRVSVNKLIKYFEDIGDVEKNIEMYKEQLLSHERMLKNKISGLKDEYHILNNVPTLINLFKRAFIALSREYECERTIDIVISFLDGNNLTDISNKHNLTRERTRQILEKGIRRLERVETYVSLLEKNRRYSSEKRDLEFRITFLEKLIKKQLPSTDLTRFLSQKLIDMDLSVRALNCLRNAEVYTIGDLVQYNKKDLLRFRNFGKKSLNELEDFLKEHGLHWGMSIYEIAEEKEL